MKKESPVTKVCKHCKTEIPFGAKICPQCRKKQGMGLGLKIVISIIVIFVLYSAVNGGNDSAKKTGSVAQGESSTEAVTTKNNKFVVGDVVSTDKLKISYLSSEDYTSKNQFILPASGNKYIKTGFEIENISSTDQFVGPYDFKCYVDGYAKDQTYLGEDLLSTTTLSAGKKVQGFMYYEVPIAGTSIDLEYETNFFSQKKITFVVK